MEGLDKVTVEALNSLKNNLLVSITSPSANKITLELQTQDKDKIYRFKLSIGNVAKLYYQRFESSIQREGFRNLKRVKLSANKKEWINQFTTWQSPFAKESGFELSLFNGSILRFVGEDILLNKEFLEDIQEFQDNHKVPNHVEQTTAKIIANTSFPRKRKTSEPPEKIKIIEQKEISDSKDFTDFDSITAGIDENQIANTQTESEISFDKIEEINIQEIGISEESLDDFNVEELKIESKQIVDGESSHENEELIQIHEVSTLNEELNDDEISTNKDTDKKSDKVKVDESLDIENIEKTDQIEMSHENVEIKPNDLLTQIGENESIGRINEDISTDENKSKKILDSNILKVNGVTSQNMDTLISSGFDTIEKLASASINQLIKIHGIGKATAKKIIHSANLLN
ncbi:MAG: hypothetical protein HeimC2_06770 [Candidatus Heimdallarchaeota archaeon LC_2]|nr:MAG: hypothetical protein HeimC2_06770 [Candidatus Heimdallarchaeota archaeon LC_2]